MSDGILDTIPSAVFAEAEIGNYSNFLQCFPVVLLLVPLSTMATASGLATNQSKKQQPQESQLDRQKSSFGYLLI